LQIFSLQPAKNGVQYIGVIISSFGEKMEAPIMANRINPFSRIRLVYRRSSTLLKCAVLAAIILSTAALLTLRFSIQRNQQQLEQLRTQAARLEQENQDLVRYTDEIGTVQSIQRIAQEELGLVDPDAIIFHPVENNP
jgi:cell division protein FtsB